MVENDFTSRCMCQCLNKTCNHVFSFDNSKKIEYNKLNRRVCPVCGHSFTIVKLNNQDDNFYINKFI